MRSTHHSFFRQTLPGWLRRISPALIGVGVLFVGNLVCGVALEQVLLPAPALAATAADLSGVHGPSLDAEVGRGILSSEDYTALPGEGTNLARPGGSGFLSGFLGSSRLSLNHSVSFGMASGSLGTAHGGLWTTRLGYRIANPLHVSVDVGAMLKTQGGSFLDADNIFLRGVNLDYAPGDNFRLHISYRGAPRGGYSGFASRVDDSPFRRVGSP